MLFSLILSFSEHSSWTVNLCRAHALCPICKSTFVHSLFEMIQVLRKICNDMSVLCNLWMNTGTLSANLEHSKRMEYFGADEFSRNSSVHTQMLHFPICAEIFGKETKLCTSHVAHHTYIRLVVVPGLRIRQRQFYLCWMLFDEFLFIFFFNVSVCGVFFGVSTVSASAYALSVSRLFICLFEMYRNRIGIRIWIRVFWGRSKFVVVAILHLTRNVKTQ